MGMIREMRNIQVLTEREADIRDYILEHPEQVGKLSSRELATVTFTSAPSVTRFYKKLGCECSECGICLQSIFLLREEWLLSYLERFLNKKLPEVIKPLLTPLICLVIMVPFTILLLGPASTVIANGIANGYNALVDIAPAVAAAIIGGFWQVFVIFGVHWGITPVCLANFDMYGRDSFQAFQTIAVVA